MTYADLKSHFRLACSGDRWGDAMGALFPVAAELYYRGDSVKPDEWRYRPGAMGGDPREPDDNWYDVARDASTATLERFGALLNRYTDLLRAAGRDY